MKKLISLTALTGILLLGACFSAKKTGYEEMTANLSAVQKGDAIQLKGIYQEGANTAVACQNSFAIAFYNGQTNALSVKKLVNGNWEQVGANVVEGRYIGQVSLKCDQNQTLYLAYALDGYDGVVNVKKYQNGQWVLLGGASELKSLQQMLFVVKNGVPYLAYQDQYGKGYVKKYQGSYWQTVGGTSYSSKKAGFAVFDVDGNDAYVYYEEVVRAPICLPFGGPTPWCTKGTYQNKMKKFNGSKWVELTGFTSDAPNYRIAADQGVVYLAYRSSSSNDIKVVKYESGQWKALGQGSAANGEDFIIQASQGALYLSYKDANSQGKLSLKKYANSAWAVLGEPGFSYNNFAVYWNTDLSVADGKVNLSYIESTANYLSVFVFASY